MFTDGEYIEKSLFYGYCSNTCPVNYSEPCLCTKDCRYVETNSDKVDYISPTSSIF